MASKFKLEPMTVCSPLCRAHLKRMEAMLLEFIAGRYVKSYPPQMWELISRSASCHRTASVTFGVRHKTPCYLWWFT